MEINVWDWLCNDAAGDRPMHLKQRIPEVLVFKGTSLHGWYGTSKGGVAVSRQVPKKKEEQLRLLERLKGTEVEQPDTPVAILRTSSTLLGQGDATPIDLPSAELLDRAGLEERIRQVENCEIKNDKVWSLQSVVQPKDGVRIVCVYSCDACGVEKSDIFARRYAKAYRTAKLVRIPEPEDVASDGGSLAVADAIRMAVEAKTLGAVRFASRFHSLDFEGLELEFIIDAEDQLVLHGCWCASLFQLDASRVRPVSKTMADDPVSPRQVLPQRVFPVPVVREEASETLSFDRTLPKAGTCGAGAEKAQAAASAKQRSRPPSASGKASAPASVLEEEPLSPDSSAAVPIDATNPWHSATEDSFITEDCHVLLEVWRGGSFLGETLLPHPAPRAPAQEHTLPLQKAPVAGEQGRASRPDSRKTRPASADSRSPPPPDRASIARVMVRLIWHGQALSVRVIEALGLNVPPTGGAVEPGGIRALLWLRRSGRTDWEPLWGSRDAVGGEDGRPWRWDEETDLGLRPAPANTGSLSLSATSRRQSIITTISNSTQLVAGARMGSQWGMSEQDGTMRTSRLASQVVLRNAGKKARGCMLVRVAGQLDRCHKAKAALDEYLAKVQAAVVDCDANEASRAKKIEELEKSMLDTEALHKAKLAKVCKDMHAVLDDRRAEAHLEAHKLAQAKQRCLDKRAKIEQIEKEKISMQDTLDKTVRKFDEVSSSYARIQSELVRTRKAGVQGADTVIGPVTPAQLQAVHEAEEQFADARKELKQAKGDNLQSQKDLKFEKEWSVKLEQYVRKIATSRATARIGGGFDMDNAAMREAAWLVQELEREAAADELRGRQAAMQARQQRAGSQPVPAN